VVLDGVTGLLVPPRDVDALAQAIERLAVDPALRARMGSAARRHVSLTFSDALVIRQHLAVYDELLARRAPRSTFEGFGILFLADNFPPETNAAATRVYERALYWAKWGYEVTVITSAPNFPQGRLFEGYENRARQIEMMGGIRVVRVKTFITANEGVVLRTLDFMSFMVSAIIAGLFEKRPSVIVSTSPQFFAAVAGWLLSALRRVPFVFELGDLWPRSIAAVGAVRQKWLLGALEGVELFLYRRAASVVALTSAFKRDLVSRGIGGEKIAVIRNGVDLPRYSPRPKDAATAEEWSLAGKFVVGYVGTHGMAHGLINVLDAAEHLRSNDDVRLILVGAGAERQMLVDEARRRNLANVVFLPMQPKGRMPVIWSLLDVALVHLKDADAFAEVIPSKIFEAMGMGLPILLVAPEGEATAIVREAGAGLCVKAGAPRDLAAAIERLKSHPDLLGSLAAKSLAAAPNHSRERQARLMIDELERVVAEGARRKGGEER